MELTLFDEEVMYFVMELNMVNEELGRVKEELKASIQSSRIQGGV